MVLLLDGLKVFSSLEYIFNVPSNKYIFLHILLFNYPKFLCLCSPLYRNICGFYLNLLRVWDIPNILGINADAAKVLSFLKANQIYEMI